MSDEQLISEVAKLWVDSGGDAEGIAWCWMRIRDAVSKEIDDRKQQEQAVL